MDNHFLDEYNEPVPGKRTVRKLLWRTYADERENAQQVYGYFWKVLFFKERNTRAEIPFVGIFTLDRKNVEEV